MLFRLSLLTLLIVTWPSVPVQAQVANPAFDVLLKGLLRNSVPLISVHQSAARQDVVFLDARDEREFAVSHIRGAIRVGYDDFQPDRIGNLRPEQPVVVYCSLGYRSERIGEKLRAAGFQQVYNLHGGIFEWVNQELPVVDQRGNPTQRIHAYDRTWGIWLQRGEKVY